MILILTEDELKEAVTNYLGDEYNIQGFNLIAGRSGNGNRVEITANRKGSEVKIVEPIIEKEPEEDNTPIFKRIED
jgi:hypothetical protein